MCHQDAGYHRPLVHIHPTAALVHHLQCLAPFRRARWRAVCPASWGPAAGATSTTRFSRVLTSPTGRGNSHRLLGAPRSASPCGLATPLCHRPLAAHPCQSRCQDCAAIFIPIPVARSATCALRLKIPEVATHESGQQELAPNRSGGRAAPDDRAPSYAAGVSPALLSTASSLSAAILHPGLGSQRAVRRETPVSPACSPPKRRGDSHPSGKRTWISFTCGLVAPKRHDLASLAPPPSLSPPGPIFIRFHVGHRHRAS